MTKLDKIVELKEQIDNAKAEISKLEGKKEGLMDSLKKDWKCTTLKKTEEKLTAMEYDLRNLADLRQVSIEKLEEKYEL